MKGNVYIGIGSNIHPEENIIKAYRLLKNKVRFKNISSCYKSPPYGNRNQSYFINTVWQIETSLSPRVLKFDVLREIEADLGRIRSKDKYADRPIDLDILLYNSLVIKDDDMEIPDPDILERPFIAVPLYQLSPELTIPGQGMSVSEIVNQMNTSRLEEVKALSLQLRSMPL